MSLNFYEFDIKFMKMRMRYFKSKCTKSTTRHITDKQRVKGSREQCERYHAIELLVCWYMYWEFNLTITRLGYS